MYEHVHSIHFHSLDVHFDGNLFDCSSVVQYFSVGDEYKQLCNQSKQKCLSDLHIRTRSVNTINKYLFL